MMATYSPALDFNIDTRDSVNFLVAHDVGFQMS